MSFSLFGIRVEVRPSFLVIAAVLGLSLGRLDLLFAWIGIIFVSILIHELGHALTARHFGSEVEIELNAIGGLTSWTAPDGDIGPGRRAMVAASGSATGLVFGGVVWLAAIPFGPYPPFADFVISNLVVVNVFWGLLNWAPIRPLDGGHLLTSLLEAVVPKRAEQIANVIFFISAAAAVAVAIWFRLVFVGLIAAWLLWGEMTKGLVRDSSPGIPPLDFNDSLDDDPEKGGDGEVEGSRTEDSGSS